jgi:NAD-dependent deacetylase
VDGSAIRWSGELGALLARPGRWVALTGAGVSAESGLATFRGDGGLWEGRDPLDLATPEAFARDPETVWRFYAWRRAQAAAAEPNPAHHALAELAGAARDFVLVTQNVDGLHERAGSEVVRLHGTLWRLRCSADGRELDDRNVDADAALRRCECGALLRPAVVWFGETLPQDAWARAERAAAACELMIVAGTSSLVHPAALLPRIALAAGARVVEVNPEPTELSPEVHERLPGPAGVVLPALARTARSSARSRSNA